MSSLRSISVLSLSLAALVAGGCNRSAGPAAASAPSPAPAAPGFPGMEADLQRTLKEQASFYRFKTAADLDSDTKGLTWDDGANLPEFADPAAKKGGTLNLAIPDFPGTFRTIGPDSNGGIRTYLMDYVALSYVNAHPNLPGAVFPEAASSWAVDSARKTVFFRLDPEARWSDGVPLTTDDVVFSFYLFRSPLVEDPWLNDYFTKTYSALTIYDAHTFSVTLKELKPDIVERAGAMIQAMPPFPKHFFQDFGPGWPAKYDWRVCPTLGAYTILPDDIKRPSSITLTRVKQWWGENKRFSRYRFNPDRIHLEVIRDPDKTFEAFVRGDIDLLSLQRAEYWYDRLSNDSPTVASGFTVKAIFYNQVPAPSIGLWINEAQPFLGNQDIRLGIQYASNFNLVCQQFFRGDAVVQKTASDGYGWDPNPAIHPRPFDPAKARAYFAKAGFSQQGPDGVLVNAQGQRLSFTITTTAKALQDVLVILKQEALKAGLEYNLEVLDDTTGFQKTLEKKHELTLSAFSNQPEMFPRYWDSFSGYNAYDVPYLPDGSPNPARKIKTNTNNLFSLADYPLDQLIKQYDQAETMLQVKRLAAPIEQMIYDDACWVNGWKMPFYRLGYRPWIKWPADFSAMQSTDYEEFWLLWIDPEAKQATLAAKADGRKLPRQVLTFDKYKEP